MYDNMYYIIRDYIYNIVSRRRLYISVHPLLVHNGTPHHQHLNLLLLFLFSFFLQDQQFQFGLWYFFNKDIKIYK